MATSSNLIQRLVERYAMDAEFQKLLLTQKIWEYRGSLWYRGDRLVITGRDLE